MGTQQLTQHIVQANRITAPLYKYLNVRSNTPSSRRTWRVPHPCNYAWYEQRNYTTTTRTGWSSFELCVAFTFWVIYSNLRRAQESTHLQKRCMFWYFLAGRPWFTDVYWIVTSIHKNFWRHEPMVLPFFQSPVHRLQDTHARPLGFASWWLRRSDKWKQSLLNSTAHVASPFWKCMEIGNACKTCL